MKKIIDIKGMHCKSCVNSIKTNISSLKGIKSIKVNLESKNAIVEYNSKIISIKEIQSEIEKLGYLTDDSSKRKNNILKTVAYGVGPHIGCIGFIIGSILGVSVLMQFFRPLLMSRYFFYELISLSIAFATISVTIYLKNNELLSLKGLKRKWKYVSITYGSTIGVNLALFLVIFPIIANISASSGENQIAIGSIESITLKVNIPCSGHAPLISEEIKTIKGIHEVKYKVPNVFIVKYDSGKTNFNEILNLAVFKEYPVKLLNKT